MRLRTFLSVLVLLAATPALAVDEYPLVNSLSGGCFEVKLCDGQTTADATNACTCAATGGTCTGPGATGSIVAPFDAGYAFTFDATETTSSGTPTFSCQVMTHRLGFTNSLPATVTPSVSISTSNITNTAPILSGTGLFGKVWVRCPSITAGTSVNIWLRACPLAH